MHQQPGKQKPSGAGSSDKDQEQVRQHTDIRDEKINEMKEMEGEKASDKEQEQVGQHTGGEE